MRVGFIGMGLMGVPMSKNILKSSFSLTIYNRTPSKTTELQQLGALIAQTPAELAASVDVLITMITAPHDVEEVLFGQNGVVSGAKKGLIAIDMSTIGSIAAKAIGQKLSKFSIEFLDAPVTGSTPKAITGELTIFVGGKEEVLVKVKPVLLAMGKTIHHMGPIGSGQAVKLINNQILAATITALSEGMILADTMQLPRKKVTEVLTGVPALSPMMTLIMPNYVEDKYPLRFSVANLQKDLTLALEELKAQKKNLPILQETQSLYTKASEALADEDFSSIIKTLED